MATKRLNRDGCTCGSGSYCHRHKRYSTPKTEGHAYDDRSVELDIQMLTRDEQCGGGRRVLRGGFGSSGNRHW